MPTQAKKNKLFKSQYVSKANSPFVLVPNTRVWEQQPKETSVAFEAFQKFLELRDLDAKNGLKETAEALKKGIEQMKVWSARWKWQDRYKQYANNRLLLKEQEQQRALRSEAQRWASRRIEIRDKGFEMGLALLAKASLILNLPVAVEDKTLTKTVVAKSGEVFKTHTVLNFEVSPKDARLMLDTALKLMRQAADMSTENITILQDDINLDDMDEAQLEEYAQMLTEMRKQQVEKGEI